MTEIQQLVKMDRVIPPQVLLQEPVILHDALGRSSAFHLDFIDSPEAFLAVLRIRFQDCGLSKIENEEFALEDAVLKHDINLKSPWSRVFKVYIFISHFLIVLTCP